MVTARRDLPAVGRVRGSVVIPTGAVRLDDLTDMVPWLTDEIRDELSGTAVRANKREMRKQNLPSRVVVDRTRGRDLGTTDHTILRTASEGEDRFFRTAQRRISFYYTNLEVLARAVVATWEAVSRLTVRSPLAKLHAADTYYWWVIDRRNPGRDGRHKSVGSVIAWIRKAEHQEVSVRLLGPTIGYRRQVIYNPRGRKQQTKWARVNEAITRSGPAKDRYLFTGRQKSLVNPERTTSSIAIRRRRRGRREWFEARVAKAIGTLVKQRIRRQYKDIWVGYSFIRSQEALPDRKPDGGQWGIHIPEIRLGIKLLGRAR